MKRKRGKKENKQYVAAYRISLALLIGAVAFLIINIVRAATPNPGHPWAEVGDGIWAATGTTALRTFTFPDTNATVLTNANDVGVADGGTGTSTLLGVLIGNGTSPISGVSILTASNGGTGNGFTSFTGPATSIKTFTLPNATSTILTDNAAVTLAQGGTGQSLVASNGGIFYSGSTSSLILAGTATAGQILRSGASTAPTWSTATYPSTAGTAGNQLISDGTNWVSQIPPTGVTFITRPPLATGAIAAVAVNSQTVRNVGVFQLSERITINQITFNAVATTTPGTIKICIYNEDGTVKVLDATSTSVVAGTANNNVTISPAVTLDPDKYYVAIGCATACNDTINTWTTTAAGWINGVSTPSGKRIYEGQVTHASGKCDSTLGTITGSNSKVPVLRLDN